MPTTPRCLADPATLVGDWRLSRVVDDRLAGLRSTVAGRLSIEAHAPGRLRWTERGVWHLDGRDHEVRRTLWLVRDESGDAGAWWVRFEDGREFHPWAPGGLVVHPCGADTYRGVVSGTPDRWTVEWDVSGPAKDYRMTTDLSADRPA